MSLPTPAEAARPAATRAMPLASRFGLAWVPVLALILGLLVQLTAPRHGLGDLLYDASLRAVASPRDESSVLVVDIDDASLRALRPRLGPWPYPRDVYALALGYLRELGAQQVALDVVLAEARSGDDALARALGDWPDVVLAGATLRQAQDAEPVSDDWHQRLTLPAAAPGEPAWPAFRDWQAVALPQDRLLAARPPGTQLGAVGIISTPLDPDGRVRSLPLLHEVQGRLYPSMALATHLQRPPAPDARLRHEPGHLVLGPWRWPVDEHGRVSLKLPANPDAVPSLAFSTLMAAALGLNEGAGLQRAVQGRTVFIGSSAFLADAVMTPTGSLPGTQLLALAHAGLARGAVIDRHAPWASAALLGVAALPALALCWRRRPAPGTDAAAATLALVLVVGLALGGLHWHHTEARLLPALVVTTTGFALAVLLQLAWAARANRQLTIDRAVAEAANRAKTEFLANVSHEVRTPMNALLGVAELLQRTPLNAEQQRLVDVFRRSGSTLFELINDLLDLSKIEAGRLDLTRTPFSLHRLLAEQCELLAPRAAAKGLRFDWTVDAALRDVVLGDRLRLGQVLLNLVGNAIKFTPSGEVHVWVDNDPATGCVRIAVRDTGIGIDRAQQQRIFEPFVQADGSASRHFGGTGLGLAIARSLAHRMGGRIDLTSVPGGGSTFTAVLPLPASPDPLDEVADAPSSLATAPSLVLAPHATVGVGAAPLAGNGRPFRVLLTEDNEVNVMLVQAMLDGAGIALTLAPNGEAALERLRAERFDLVLMDVQMPGLDGHATTRALRAHEREAGLPPVPVIALTAHAYDSDVARSFEAGCSAHLTKPVSREALLAAINVFRPPAAPSD